MFNPRPRLRRELMALLADGRQRLLSELMPALRPLVPIEFAARLRQRRVQASRVKRERAGCATRWPGWRAEPPLAHRISSGQRSYVTNLIDSMVRAGLLGADGTHATRRIWLTQAAGAATRKAVP